MAVLVVVLALVVVAVAVTVGIARRGAGPSRTVHLDPFTVGEPWRRHVSAAQSTQRRFDAIVAAVPAGPLHERLAAIGRQVGRGVAECGQIAKRGDEVDDVLRRIDSTSIRARLDRATDETTRASLQTQLDAATRIRTIRDGTDQRLRTLNARLDELVAQAAEVSIGADTTAELGSGIDDVITELEALRLAIEDVDAAAAGRPTPAPPTVAPPTSSAPPPAAPPPPAATGEAEPGMPSPST